MNVQNKCTVPAVSNLSFGEPENIKQILWREMEYYDFNVMDDSQTRRFVGRKGDEYWWQLEFKEGAKVISIGK